MTKTNWNKIENVFKIGSQPNEYDGVFVALGENDKKLLKKALETNMGVNKLEYDFDKINPQYYLERSEATHMFVSIIMPANGLEEFDCWDFIACLAKEDKDGNMLIWSGDIGEVGTVYYQQSYTKRQAYTVAGRCKELIEYDKLFNDFEDNNYYDYIKKFLNEVSIIMKLKEVVKEKEIEVKEDPFKIDIVITDKFIGTLKKCY